MKEKLSIVVYTQGLPFAGDALDKQALGGAETCFIYLCRELSRLGHEVQAFCPCLKPGMYDGVLYSDVNKFQEWVKIGSCNLFICSRFYQIFSLPVPATVKVLWLHDHLLGKDADEIKKRMPAIDFIYCLSDYHAAYTAGFFKDYFDKIKITANGIDLDLVRDVTKDVHSKKHRIMYTSRPERGLGEALYVYEKLNDKELELLICTYPYPNEEFSKRMMQHIETLRQKGFSIRFEQFNKRKLYRNIAESLAVIYPSNTPEIFCLSAVEAQACRTVFLGRQLGALGETVGYPSQKNNDADAFAHIVKKVLEDKAGRELLEELGWQHVQKYNWHRIACQFIDDASLLIQTGA